MANLGSHVRKYRTNPVVMILSQVIFSVTIKVSRILQTTAIPQRKKLDLVWSTDKEENCLHSALHTSN